MEKVSFSYEICETVVTAVNMLYILVTDKKQASKLNKSSITPQTGKTKLTLGKVQFFNQCGDWTVLLKIDNFAWYRKNLEEILKVIRIDRLEKTRNNNLTTLCEFKHLRTPKIWFEEKSTRQINFLP